MSLRTRIAEILQNVVDGNQAELARLAGVSRSAVGQWLSGETEDIKAMPAFKIQDKLDFSARWIADGTLPKKVSKKKELDEGSPVDRGGEQLRVYYLTSEEDRLLQAFRRVLPETQPIAIEQVKLLVLKNKRGDADIVPIKQPKPRKSS